MSKTVMINAVGDGIRMMTSEEEERRRAKVEQLVCRVTRQRERQSRCSTAAGSVSLSQSAMARLLQLISVLGAISSAYSFHLGFAPPDAILQAGHPAGLRAFIPGQIKSRIVFDKT